MVQRYTAVRSAFVPSDFSLQFSLMTQGNCGSGDTLGYSKKRDERILLKKT